MKRTAIVVGAGIVGSAVAFELARRGISDVHVLDTHPERLEPGTTAGGCVHHLWMNRVNMDLARCSMAQFGEWGQEVGFHKAGSVWLFAQSARGEGEALLHRAIKNNLEYRSLSPAELKTRLPFLDHTADLAFALEGPRDGVLEPGKLFEKYRSLARDKGALFESGVGVAAFRENDKGVEVAGTKDGQPHTWKADYAVLCAGAGTTQLLKGLVDDPMTAPVTQQHSTFAARVAGLESTGFVVDTSRVFFHADHGQVTAGFTPAEGQPATPDPAFFETSIGPALRVRSSAFARVETAATHSRIGSRTLDAAGILGFVPGHHRLIEAHGFANRAVLQSYGIAVAVTDLICEGKFIHIDALGLTRERFQDPKVTWLFEALPL